MSGSRKQWRRVESGSSSYAAMLTQIVGKLKNQSKTKGQQLSKTQFRFNYAQPSVLIQWRYPVGLGTLKLVCTALCKPSPCEVVSFERPQGERNQRRFEKVAYGAVYVITSCLNAPSCLCVNLQVWKSFYCILLTTLSMASDLLPSPVTAFIPVVVLHLTGIMSPDELAAEYMNVSDTVAIAEFAHACGQENNPYRMQINLFNGVIISGGQVSYSLLEHYRP